MRFASEYDSCRRPDASFHGPGFAKDEHWNYFRRRNVSGDDVSGVGSAESVALSLAVKAEEPTIKWDEVFRPFGAGVPMPRLFTLRLEAFSPTGNKDDNYLDQSAPVSLLPIDEFQPYTTEKPGFGGSRWGGSKY